MRGNEVIQDVALLLLQRRHHCHHALDKTRAVFALRAKATFAPLHTRTDGALSHIVGRLNALNLHERPQCLAALENLAAHPFGFGYPTLATDFEEALDLAAKLSYRSETSIASGCLRAPDATTQTSGVPA